MNLSTSTHWKIRINKKGIASPKRYCAMGYMLGVLFRICVFPKVGHPWLDLYWSDWTQLRILLCFWMFFKFAYLFFISCN